MGSVKKEEGIYHILMAGSGQNLISFYCPHEETRLLKNPLIPSEGMLMCKRDLAREKGGVVDTKHLLTFVPNIGLMRYLALERLPSNEVPLLFATRGISLLCHLRMIKTRLESHPGYCPSIPQVRSAYSKLHFSFRPE